MIIFAEACSAGNAVKLVLTLEPWAFFQRVLVKAADTFTGADDPNALTVVDECSTTFAVDARDSLVNGVQVFYRAYSWDGAAWLDQGISFPVTPATAYVPGGVEVQELVRDRVQLGITAAVAAGRLTPASGKIDVTTAPFSLSDNTTFPTISVHFQSGGQDQRVVGDEMEDFFDTLEQKWTTTEGWLAREALNIVGVSQNSDERITLRGILRDIMIANLPVFAGAGLALVEFSQTDSEQFSENSVPLYFANGAFSCVAPAFIRDDQGLIDHVTLNPGVQSFGMPNPDYYGAEEL